MANCAAATPELFSIGSTSGPDADLASFRALCANDQKDYAQRFALQQPQYSHPLRCLKPAAGSWSVERHAPLKQRLVRGRVCSHELCAVDNCALHLRDEVVLPTEADLLVEHGQLVLDAEDAASQQDTNQKSVFGRSRRVDFVQSVTYGSHGGHLLCLRIVERLRRIAASAFNLPITRLLVAEHFLTLRQAGPSLEPVAHCDEAVFPHGEGVKGRWRFHFSAVLWLNDAGRDFDGGELAFYRASATEKAPDDFYHNATAPALLVSPSVGRAAFFSSGWENVHGIKPVTRGQRWALTTMFMVQDEPAPRMPSRTRTPLSTPADARQSVDDVHDRVGVGGEFLAQCVRSSAGSQKIYANCRRQWAAAMR